MPKRNASRFPVRSVSAKRARSVPRNKRRVTSRIARPVSLGRQVLPPLLSNTVTYSDAFVLQTNVSGYNYYLFSANGLYDPNISGTGHQPYYFDQLANMYNHYTVMSSKITVYCFARDGTAVGIQNTLFVDDDTDPMLALSTDAPERPGAITWFSNPNQQPDKGATKYWNAKSTFGGNVMDNDDLRGSSLANPSEQSFFCIVGAGPATESYSYRVIIDYNVIWDELKTRSAS